MKVGNIRTLRGCEVSMFDGIHVDPVICGRPGHWWTAPTGRSFFVCREHREGFEATDNGRSTSDG